MREAEKSGVSLQITGTIDIAKLALTPGDLLIAHVDHTLDSDLAHKIRVHIEDALETDNPVLVLDKSVSLSVLTAEQLKKRIGRNA